MVQPSGSPASGTGGPDCSGDTTSTGTGGEMSGTDFSIDMTFGAAATAP